MKKYFLAAFFVCLILFTSGCEKENAKEIPHEESDPYLVEVDGNTVICVKNNNDTQKYIKKQKDYNFMERQNAVPDEVAAARMAMAAAKSVPGGDNENLRPVRVEYSSYTQMWTVWIDDHPYSDKELGTPLIVIIQKKDGKILHIGI